MAHTDPPVVKDTIESIHANVTNKILLHVDAAGWDKFEGRDFSPAILSKGLYHGFNHSPYRNSVLGVKRAYEHWPHADWYCYTEYDCLFVSPAFKEDLQTTKAWCLGMNYRTKEFKAHFLSEILGEKIKRQHYFLGACMFFHNDFIAELHKRNFFDGLLKATKDFKVGHFPDKNCWAFEEVLWPSVAVALKGKLKELAFYGGAIENGCKGKCKRYVVRYTPNISLGEVTPLASIIHPLKRGLDHPIRQEFRNQRRNAGL